MAKSRRAKKQISKVNPKMGYFGGPNMPLSQKSGFKTILVSFWRPNREEMEKKRGGRGRREEEKESQAKKVWKLTLFMNPMRLCMNFHALMVILLPKSRVLLGFHLNPKFMESKVGKTPHGTRWLLNPSFEDGFML